MKKILPYLLPLALFLTNCTGKNSAKIGVADGITSIEITESNLADTILTGDDMNRFDSLFNAWIANYNSNPDIRLSSDTRDARKLEQYPQLLAMGKKIIPCIITRLPDKSLFWTLSLYDDLQEIDSLKCYDYSHGEQFRTQETVRKYVEAKLHKKKRVFHSDIEKLQAMRQLLQEYGWEEDTALSPHEVDSVLLNMDYEITEDMLKLFKYGGEKE